MKTSYFFPQKCPSLGCRSPRLSKPLQSNNSSSVAKWKQIQKEINVLSDKINELSHEEQISKLQRSKSEKKGSVRKDRYVSEAKNIKHVKTQQNKYLSLKPNKALQSSSTAASLHGKTKRNRQDRKTKDISFQCNPIPNEVNCLKLMNQNLMRQNSELQKKLFFSNLENKSMKNQLNKVLHSLQEQGACFFQDSAERGRHNLSQEEKNVRKALEESNLMSAVSISPEKCRKILDLSSRTNTKTISELEKKFDILVEKSRMQRNKMRKRQLWSQMRDVASQIKFKKQQ